MATYRVQAPNGRTYRIEGPPGASEDEVIQQVLAQYPDAANPPQPKKGVLAQAAAGAERGISDVVAGATGLFGDASAAAKAGLQRQQEIGSRYADEIGLDRLKQAYQERGLGAAAGELARQVPLALAQQAPQLAATVGGARLGAMAGAPFGPAGAVIGGVGGAALPNLMQFFGQNIQEQEQATPGRIDKGAAGAAAAGQTALDVAALGATLGLKVAGKLLGEPFQQAVAKYGVDGAKRLAQQSFMRAAGSGALRGLAAEVPTEILQDMMQKGQAGQDIFSDDALRGYGETAYQTALVAPVLGGGARVTERRDAQTQQAQLEQQRRAQERAAAVQAQQAQAAQQEAFRASPQYLTDLGDRYDAFKQQFDALQAQVKALSAGSKTDPAAKEAYRLAQQQLSELVQENRALVQEYVPLRGRIEQARRTPQDVFLEQSLEGGREGMGRRAGRGQLTTDAPAPDAAATAAAYAQEQAEAAQSALGVPQVQDYLSFLLRDPQMAALVAQQRAPIPGLKPADQRALYDAIRLQLKEQQKAAAAQQKAESRAAMDERVQGFPAVRTQPGGPDFSQWLADTEALDFDRREGQTEADIRSTERAAAGLQDMREQPRLFPEQEAQQRMVEARGPGARTRPQLEADLLIARATGNRDAAQQAVEQLRARTQEGRPEPEGYVQPDRTLEQAMGMAVPRELDRQQEQRDLRDLAFAQYVSLLDRFNRGRAQRQDLLDAERRIVDATVREVEALNGAPLEPAQRQDLLREIASNLRDLEGRFGDTRAEVNVGTRDEPEMEPVQRPGGAFRTDLPGEGAGPTGFGLENQETRDAGQRTLTRRFDAAQAARERIEQARNKLVQAPEARPGVDRPGAEDLNTALERAGDDPRAQALRPLANVLQPAEREAAQQYLYRRRVGQPAPELEQEIDATLARYAQAAEGSGAQLDLAPDTELQGTIFNSYPEFEKHLASDALQEQRKAIGLVRQTAQRVFERTGPLRRRIAGLEAEIARLTPTLEAVRAAKASNAAITAKWVQEAEAQLLKLQRELDAELTPLQTRFLGAQLAFVDAQNRAAETAAMIEANNYMLEQTIAEHEAENKDFAAQYKALKDAQADLARSTQTLKLAKGRLADSTARMLSGGWDHTAAEYAQYQKAQGDAARAKQTALVAHGRLMRANAALPRPVAELPSALFREYLLKDSQMQDELNTLRRQFGGLAAAQSSAKRALDRAAEQVRALNSPRLQAAQQNIEAARELQRSTAEADKVEENRVLKALDAAGLPLEDQRRIMAGVERALARQAQSRLGRPADTQGQREARANAERQQAQAVLETREQTPTPAGTPLPATQVSFQRRRAWEEQLNKAPERMAELELQLLDPNISEEAKAAAREELAQREAALQERVAARARGEAADIAQRNNLQQKVRRLQAQLAAPKMNDAARPAVQARLDAAVAKLNQVDARIEKRGGVTRTPVPTREERAEARATQEYGVPSETAERLAASQKTRRATSPAMREIGPRMARVFESTKPVVGTRAASRRELKEAGKIAAQMRAKGPKERAAETMEALARVETALDRLPELQRTAQANLAIAEQAKNKPRIAQLKETLAEIERRTSRLKDARNKLQAKLDREAPDFLRSEGVGTPLSTDAMRGIKAGDAAAAVNNIASTSDDAFTRRVARTIAPMLRGVTVKTVPKMPGDMPNAPGGISADGRRMQLNETNGLTEETLMHEAVHSATLAQLSKPEEALTNEQQQAKRELEQLHQMVRENPNIDNEVAKDPDLREFVAEALGSRTLAAQLQAMPTPKPRTSGWQWFKESVLRLLGIKTPPAANVRDRVLELTEKFMAPPLRTADDARGEPAFYRAKVDEDSALSRFGERITAQDQQAPLLKDRNLGLLAEMWGVDMRAPVLKALSQGEQRNYEQAMYNIRKADARMPQVYATLSKGAPKLVKDASGIYYAEAGHSASVVDLLDAVRDVPGVSEQDKLLKTQAYFVAQRAANKGWDKLGFDVSAEMQRMGQEVMAEVAADPKLKSALDNARTVYNDYNRGLISFLADTGAITKTLAKELLKDGDYVPFYRVNPRTGAADLVLGETAQLRVGDLKNQPYLQQLKGDDEKLLPLHEAVMRNTMLLLDMGFGNLARRSTAYALQDMGRGAGDKGANTNVIKVAKDGKTPEGSNILRFKQEPNPNDRHDTGERYIEVDLNGTAAEGIPTEMFMRSLEGTHTVLPAFVKLAGTAGDILRGGITRNPVYVLRQLIRDPFAAAFTAGADRGPVTATLKAFREFGRMYRGGSETSDTLVRKGVVQSGIFTGDPDDLGRFAKQLVKGDQSAITKLAAMADQAAMRADAAARAQVYEDALKRTGSEAMAELAAIELMNFSKRGLSPTVQYFSRMIPFFNAQIQGLNVLYKAATGKATAEQMLDIKRKFWSRAVGLMSFATLYALAMEDDETYKNAAPQDRYSNFFIPIAGGQSLAIPIPYEVGLLFKALPEAMVTTLKGEMDEAQWQGLRSALLNTIPGASNFMLPQLAKPVLEVATNSNFFTGREIERPDQRELNFTERFTTNTTEMAKTLSRMLDTPLTPDAAKLSPVQIEHLVRGYLGSLPMAGMALMNEVFAQQPVPGVDVEQPERRLRETPVLGQLVRDTYGYGAISAAYAKFKAVDEAGKTFDKMLKEGRVQAAKEYLERNVNVLQAEPLAKRFRQDMLALRTQEARVRQAANMSAQAKREALNTLIKNQQTLADRYVEALARVAPD